MAERENTIKNMTNLENVTSIDQIPLVLSVTELGQVLHIGHCSAYKLLNSGKIRSFRIGKNIRIPRDALMEFLSGIA